MFVLVLYTFTALPRQAVAEQDDSSYRELVKNVTGGNFSVDFRALRFACLNASSCDPQGDPGGVSLMRRAIQDKQYDKAAKAADKLIKQGFANLEAHVISSEAYAALKNPERAQFHHDVAASLIRSILTSGDGKTKETAFEVIGVHEEYIVMSVLGLPRPGSQSLMPGKPHSYDVLEVQDPKTGQKVSVYFNIDAFYPPKGLR